MFHQNFLRFNALKARLSEKIEVSRNLMNQDIHVRDIIISAENNNSSFGEYFNQTSKYRHIPVLERLVDQVRSLAAIANLYHHQYYCNKNDSGVYTIKQDCLNKITRVLMNEFFLYTEEPLDMTSYAIFVENVHELASKQSENVHLLLSSVCVVTEDMKLLNISLYVQCGAEPKISSICKARPSPGDPDFEDIVSFEQQDIHEADAAISAYVSSVNANTIPNNSILFIKTLGGAEYVQAIDICLDHKFGHSKNLIKNLLDSDVQNNSFFIPHQADHVITSNSLKQLNQEFLISRPALHIDPRKKLPASMKEDVLSISDLEIIKSDKYSSLTVVASNGCLVVKNPCFGGSYKIIVAQERQLDGFALNLKDDIEYKNEKTMNYKLKLFFSPASARRPDVPRQGAGSGVLCKAIL